MADMRTPSQNNFDDLKTPTALFHPDVASSHASSGLGPTHNFGGPSHSKQSTPPLVNAPPPARSSNSSGMKSRARSHTTTSYGLHQPIDRPSVVSLPNYPALSEAGPLPAHTIPGRAARSVWIKFNIHLDSMLDSVRALRFDQFEQQLRSFWHLPDDEREVCHAPSMAGIMSRAETIVFDVSHRFHSADLVYMSTRLLSVRTGHPRAFQVAIASAHLSGSGQHPPIALAQHGADSRFVSDGLRI